MFDYRLVVALVLTGVLAWPAVLSLFGRTSLDPAEVLAPTTPLTAPEDDAVEPQVPGGPDTGPEEGTPTT